MSERTNEGKDARRRALRALATDLGHEFADFDLLDRALTHASTGNDGKANYERLEFLGDAILNFAVADALFRRTPEIPEGELTEARALLVSRPPLAAIARQLNLVNLLDVGKGLRESERGSERILADLVEAVLGAIYIDGGVRAARAFVKRFVLPRVADLQPAEPTGIDAKTALLHFCQRHKLGQPKYELVETTGLQHLQEFLVSAKVADGRKAEGTGRNKRAAEKVAAQRLLTLLHAESPANSA